MFLEDTKYMRIKFKICLYFIYLFRSSPDWPQTRRDPPVSVSKY